MVITDYAALYFSGETYIKKDSLIIVFVIISAILFLNVWLRYKAHRKLQKSEEKYRLLVTEREQEIAVHEQQLAVINTDISELKRLGKQAIDEKERFKATLLSAGDGVISTDNQGKVELLNKVAEQLTGWTQEEASGKKFDEVFNIINEFTRDKSENLVQTIFDSGKPLLLANHRILIAKEGIERPVEENVAPIKDGEGNIKGAVLVFRDYTEKKKGKIKLNT